MMFAIKLTIILNINLLINPIVSICWRYYLIVPCHRLSPPLNVNLFYIIVHFEVNFKPCRFFFAQPYWIIIPSVKFYLVCSLSLTLTCFNRETSFKLKKFSYNFFFSDYTQSYSIIWIPANSYSIKQSNKSYQVAKLFKQTFLTFWRNSALSTNLTYLAIFLSLSDKLYVKNSFKHKSKKGISITLSLQVGY